MATYVVLVLGAVDDPVVAVEKLLDRARARPLDGGVGWLLEADEVDEKRAQTRARQARYRARRRDARDAIPRDARDAADLVENPEFDGPQLPADRREVGPVAGPENDANDARRDDARDATRRDALELSDALAELADLDPVVVGSVDVVDLADYRDDDQPGSPWRAEAAEWTDERREAYQNGLRALRETLKRTEGP